MKNPFALAVLPLTISLLVSCGSAEQASDQAEQANPMTLEASNKLSSAPFYLRGGFNGWGTEDEFKSVSDGVYSLELDVKKGLHTFKIAPQDWSQEWVANVAQRSAIDLEKSLPLQVNTGGEDYLLVTTPARYRFSVDLSAPATPSVKVEKLADITISAQMPEQPAETTYTSHYQAQNGSEYLAKYTVKDEQNGLRTYLHSTTQELRDPGAPYSEYSEAADLPKVRTGDLEFDALFALAINEMGYLSVDTINDGAYNEGKSIDCQCFKTGEKWAYVWTRDLSYAADLSLAFLDPSRVTNSLNFKLSKVRAEVANEQLAVPSGLHIIQDTGSGGSWPISTDRMTWAFGAEAALNSLSGKEKAEFASRAFEALQNSIAVDRAAAYDPADGLYTGEQSFLDWRVQTYALWILDDLSSMSSAKALSTNVTHYQALNLAARLAKEVGQTAKAKQYEQWAKQLKTAINNKLWLADKGLYSSLTAGHFDDMPLQKYDWLGQSLAIISGVADQKQAEAILANYPHGPMGAPVIFPQQPDVPVYHNRAIWPFVTAYGLNAAAKAGNSAVANSAYHTLIRTAALNMSNMENLEWLTADPLYMDEIDPWMSGPVINSNYQLWSVAGYLNMVVNNVFGLKVTEQGLRFAPFITAELRNERFANRDTIELQNLGWKGLNFDIQVRFPTEKSEQTQGHYPVAQVLLNGKPVSTALTPEQLNQGADITVILGDIVADQGELTSVQSQPNERDPQVEAPAAPLVQNFSSSEAGITFDIIEPKRAQDAVALYSLIRNGEVIVSNVSATELIDVNPINGACYSVMTRYVSGTQSHHSRPICTGNSWLISADSAQVTSNKPVVTRTKQLPTPHIANWGAPTDSLTIDQIDVPNPGKYAFQISYTNTSNAIGEGITSGVKLVKVLDQNGKVVAQDVLHLPHTLFDQNIHQLGMSTPLIAELAAGEYRVTVSDFFNMSYLSSNDTYGRAGGQGGPRNHFDFVALQVQELSSANSQKQPKSGL